MKRLFDLVGASLLLLLSLPLFVLAAVGVKLSSPGPILFGHRRVGKDGHEFRCLKLRTMVVDAEEWLDRDPDLRRRHQGNGYKLPRTQDPRVTRFGHFLRFTHIDELPQLLNVLKGDMSLVGPRPLVEEELEWYGKKRGELLSVRPGVFGPWTGQGKARVTYPERVEVELEYVRDQSVLKDMGILAKNVPVVLTGQVEEDERSDLGGVAATERGGKQRFRFAADALHRHRLIVSLFLYGAVTALGYALAFFLRFELAWPGGQTKTFWTTLPLLLGLRLTLARTLKLSSSRWRFISTREIVRLLFATSIGSLFFFILTWQLAFPASVPRSIIALEWILTSYGTAGMWLLYRVTFQQLRHAGSRNGEADRRVLVVGAGEAGAMLIREMVRLPTGYRPVGMVDDDPLKWGTTIEGVEVIGSIEDVKTIAGLEKAQELIVAIPTAVPGQLSRIVELCEGTDLTFKLLPGIAEVLSGQADLQQLRPLRVEDLLGREPIYLELPELADELEGKSILVTGAAGSIGSELSRQVALHRPGKLILLDQAETPLVELDLDLRERFPELEIIPVVADITNASGVESLFRAHRPYQVFHAAAYKHVPVMEVNAEEAVRNNVLGTWKVARAAGEHRCEKLVLISTDKAVRPVNVMGATKRLAERVVLEAQERYPDTAFAAVRFGNVLGSNGSVIPVFRKQMAEGRPLTVTHPNVTRYFMTISEAVQLVLQSSLLPGIRGHVAMLEMGEPVRIVELARKMLRLAGRPAVEGRDIVFTGLRPGEKLHEELVAPEEATVATEIPKVQIVLLDQEGGPAAWGLVPALEEEENSGLDGEALLAGVLECLSSEENAPVLQYRAHD